MQIREIIGTCNDHGNHFKPGFCWRTLHYEQHVTLNVNFSHVRREPYLHTA